MSYSCEATGQMDMPACPSGDCRRVFGFRAAPKIHGNGNEQICRKTNFDIVLFYVIIRLCEYRSSNGGGNEETGLFLVCMDL